MLPCQRKVRSSSVMSFASRITALLVGVTPGQIRAMNDADRQLLDDQCQRVRRLIEGTRVDEHNARQEPRSGVLMQLKSGDPRHE